jgi:hypothetical protein
MVAHEALHTPGLRLLFRVQTNLVEEVVRNRAARFGCAQCREHAWGNCTRLLQGLDKSHSALDVEGHNNRAFSLSLSTLALAVLSFVPRDSMVIVKTGTDSVANTIPR